MSLQSLIRDIQRTTSVPVDGIFGRVTAQACLRALFGNQVPPQELGSIFPLPLSNLTLDLQKFLGIKTDGIFGPQTATALLTALRTSQDAPPPEIPLTQSVAGNQGLYPLPERTLKIIRSLDPKAQAAFIHFAALAEATAATLRCDYIAICGLRTYQEQDALYAKGRSKPGKIITNAPAGFSWHNFGVAVDFGVFRQGKYLDDTDPTTAELVHRACAHHAASCGLVWGGTWTKFPDTPHYQLASIPTSPLTRHRLQKAESGSIFT